MKILQLRLLVVKQLAISWTECWYLNMLLSYLSNYFDSLGSGVSLCIWGWLLKCCVSSSLSLSCDDSSSFLLPPGPALVQSLPSSVQTVCESWNNISTNEFPNIGSWVSVRLSAVFGFRVLFLLFRLKLAPKRS